MFFHVLKDSLIFQFSQSDASVLFLSQRKQGHFDLSIHTQLTDVVHLLPRSLSRGRIARAAPQRAREIGRAAMHVKPVPLCYVVNMFYKYRQNISIPLS